ncbi:hypothetical protein BDY24DRAFT_411740 [Mrakia frigida]|uniref:glycosyltransferase family 8 protein n=1 Tax=Mrakia frigida TaxID=29902 RepID=UPI003FCC11F7
MVPSAAPSQSYAFVTLLSSTSYLPGALVLGHSLRSLHRPSSLNPIPFKLVCLVTPETVDAKSIKQLREVWDLVVGVEVLECSGQQEGLGLLGRPDLATVLTKLHVFRLAPFTKIIFLDADVLPLRPLSHLFAIPHPFSAAPDTGWPDCFNSGVMVLEPSEQTFEGLREMMLAGKGQRGGGSFDGGDQGILNQYFNGEDGRPEWNRISFTYNTTPTAAYTYAPAYSHYGPTINCVHFIGANKPWSSLSYRASRPTPCENLPFDYQSLVDRWFGVYDKFVRSSAEDQKRFEVPVNVAAWEEEGSRATAASYGLEELKAIATQGWGNRDAAEGGYTSLPLDGRIDLMRARLLPAVVESEKEVEQPHQHHEEATRIVSPQPVLHAGTPYFAIWDPALGPPPKGEGKEFHQMQEPIDSKYGNAWDASAWEAKEDERRWREGGQGGQAVWDVPLELRDGRYNVTTQQADSSLVGKIFPWESRTRSAPSRVFPRGETPPPARSSPPSSNQTVHDHTQSENQYPHHHNHQPPPPATFQSASKYVNAWDAVPAIQKYVTRLTGPPANKGKPISSSSSRGGSEGTRTPPGSRGRREERGHGGLGGRKEPSRDGGDEGDDEEEESEESQSEAHGETTPPAGKKRDGRGGGGGGGGAGLARPSSRGSRGGDQHGHGGSSSRGHNNSSSASYTYPSHGNPSKNYANSTSQTDRTGTREAGVQYHDDRDDAQSESASSTNASQLESGSSTPTNSSQERERLSRHSPSQQRPPAHPSAPTSPVTATSSVPPLRAAASKSGSAASAQEDLGNLKRYGFEPSKPKLPLRRRSQEQEEFEREREKERERVAALTSVGGGLAHARQESSETVTSAGTSAGVVTPLGSPEMDEGAGERGGRFAGKMGGVGGQGTGKGRTWDPARNVEQFKTETVSVLHRFMRSAQEEQQQQQQQ